MTGSGGRRRWLQESVAIGLALGVPGARLPAEKAVAPMRFDIAAGTLDHALAAFAAATGQQLLYSTDMVAGHEAAALEGRYDPDAALARLLRGSGLAMRRVGPRTIIVEPARAVILPGAARRTAEPPASADAPAADPPIPPPALPARESGARQQADADAPNEIIVTGTHIRGRNPGSPPVTIFTRADLERNGYASVAQALQALPGNFGGTATEQSALALADTTFSNSGFATGVNLRGLGAGATLVLVDGQRLGGSGTEGAFSDVSGIPTGAVDRVEVLLDGASAIYGSDAVGGVVNIILKREFDGAETRARLGTVTAGGKRDLQIDQTLGRQWGGGGVMLSYEYDRNGRLASADRAFARSDDSRPFGGTDHRALFSLPGNVIGIDPATGAFGPAYAIPGGQDGTGLTPASFRPGVINLQNSRIGTDLIPLQTLHSLYAAAHQDLGETLHLKADARYSHRAFDVRGAGSAALIQIDAHNPFFVSPTGASSDLIAYSLAPELGPTRTRGYAEALSGSIGLDADLGASWKARSYAAFAQERDYSDADHIANTAALAEASGIVPDDPATGFSTATDGFFNPYGTGTSNSAAILAFVGNGFSISRTRGRISTGHVDADGTLLDLPGGSVKLAVGGDVRHEGFARSGTDLLSTALPQATTRIRAGRTVEAGFAELRVPIIGEDNALSGLRRLDLSAAARVEHYGDFGTTTNPKVGAAWVPVDGFTIRTSYGTSFRAPNLRELRNPQRYSMTTLQRADGTTVPVLQLSGGDPDLKPETARSWTAGFDLVPKLVPGLDLSVSWFRTIFSRRIGAPVNDNFDNALVDSTLAPFVEVVSPGTNPADRARVEALVASPAFTGGIVFPPSSIGAIVDTRSVNTGRVDVSGIDLSLHYTMTAGTNRFDLTATGSYLLRYRVAVTPAAPAIDERNRAGEPVDLRGRLSAGWTRGTVNALVAMNYVAPYHDLSGGPIAHWTTFDLTLGATAPKGSGALSGFAVSLAATNIFAKAPPFYDSQVGAGYDATNADALGRFVALQVTKRW